MMPPKFNAKRAIIFVRRAEENDMLRLDSMLLLVQLHIRYALKAQARPPPAHAPRHDPLATRPHASTDRDRLRACRSYLISTSYARSLPSRA